MPGSRAAFTRRRAGRSPSYERASLHSSDYDKQAIQPEEDKVMTTPNPPQPDPEPQPPPPEPQEPEGEEGEPKPA